MDTIGKPKILLAPMNAANIPMYLVRELRNRGYEASHILYTNLGKRSFSFDYDRLVNFRKMGGRLSAQMQVLASALEEGFDIFHFWNKSLFYRIDLKNYSSLDYLLLKAHGKKIIHRFTGYDLRYESLDLKVNPFSAFRHGFKAAASEKFIRAQHDFIRECADQLLVQDPELQQFCPDAKIIPRAVNLDEWRYVGPHPDRAKAPLVIHVPSNSTWKGTKFVLRAVKELQHQGLKFDFQLVKNLPHAEARELYKRADILIDGMLVGTTGVSTLEGLALGKTVVNYTREDLFCPFYGVKKLPLVNANIGNLSEKLKEAIADYDMRAELAPVGRELIEAHHDIKRVVQQFIDLYNDVFARPFEPIQGRSHLQYIELQATEVERLLSRLMKRFVLIIRRFMKNPVAMIKWLVSSTG